MENILLVRSDLVHASADLLFELQKPSPGPTQISLSMTDRVPFGRSHSTAPLPRPLSWSCCRSEAALQEEEQPRGAAHRWIYSIHCHWLHSAPGRIWGAPATSIPVQTRVQLWAEGMKGGQGWEKANREKTETEAKEEGKGAFCLRLQSFLAWDLHMFWD